MIPGTRILVAEDEPELLHAVADALRHEGAEVVCAETGDQLISLLAHEPPFALVVSDVSMPWMSGLHVMHTARYAGVVTPVIIMTALKDERIAEQVRALGANVILLRKPFDLHELESAVAQLLAVEASAKARQGNE
jgi:DNA-binding response OmpR family regulator